MNPNNRIFKNGIFYLLLILLSLTVAILANLVMDALPTQLTYGGGESQAVGDDGAFAI